jgi:hypothetical protein
MSCAACATDLASSERVRAAAAFSSASAATRETLAEIDLYVRRAADRVPDPETAVKALHREINLVYPPSHSQRPFVTMLVQRVFSRAIELVAAGQYPSAYVEAHALLEEIAIALLPRRIGTTNEAIVSSLIRRKTLSEIAPMYAELGLWAPPDVAFIGRLAGVRNGVSHRNFHLLAKHVGRKTQGHHLGAFNFSLDDAAKTCGKALELIVKIAKIHRRRSKARRARTSST